MNRNETIYHDAKRLGCCELLKGKEDTEQLIRLFVTRQGIEFCLKNNFPDLVTLRTFRGLQASRYGVFIDSNISRENVSKVILIGDTVAELTYTDPEKRHEVILMHGAKANITASGWAVVFVTKGKGCDVVTHISDNAKIL